MDYGLEVYTFQYQWVPYDASYYSTPEAAHRAAVRESETKGIRVRAVEVLPDPLPGLNADA